MTQSRISYHVHGMVVPDVGRLKKHLRAINPTSVLILDALGLAQEIKSDLPNCIVMHRDYQTYNGDDDVVQKISPQQWILTQRERGNFNIWRVCLNEPGFNEKTITWLNAAIDFNETFDQKLLLVVGGWAVGNPGPDDWGLAKSLLDRCDRLRDRVIVQLHEYACGVITSGLYGGWPDNAGAQPGTAGGQNLIPVDKWPEDVSKITQWHCGRFNFLVKYCQQNGIKPPRIIITEHGMDDVSDIKQWSDALLKTPPYASIRGWKSLQREWRYWWPQWSPEQAYFEQIKWADQKIYQGTVVEGQCIYCWGHSSDNWEQFDVAEAGELQGLLQAYAGTNQAEPPAPLATMPKPVNATLKITARSLISMNVRTGPALIYPKIGDTKYGEIQPGDYLRLWVVPDVPESQWTWVYAEIITGSTALKNGWLYLPEFQYTKAGTKEIPIIKPAQAHVFKVSVSAPNGDMLADWIRKQLEDAGAILSSLDHQVKFEVEEMQS